MNFFPTIRVKNIVHLCAWARLVYGDPLARVLDGSSVEASPQRLILQDFGLFVMA